MYTKYVNRHERNDHKGHTYLQKLDCEAYTTGLINAECCSNEVCQITHWVQRVHIKKSAMTAVKYRYHTVKVEKQDYRNIHG
jgi:hypothetical protein